MTEIATDNQFPVLSATIMGWLGTPGYWSLFAVSFLASSLLPLGSEWLLVLLLGAGGSPLIMLGIATLGNTLGACTSYLVGRSGSEWFVRKVLRISPMQQDRAEAWFRRYGTASLFFSWLPVIGDPLCLAGGILRIRFSRFFLVVGAGKLARYGVVVWAALKAGGA